MEQGQRTYEEARSTYDATGADEAQNSIQNTIRQIGYKAEELTDALSVWTAPVQPVVVPDIRTIDDNKVGQIVLNAGLSGQLTPVILDTYRPVVAYIVGQFAPAMVWMRDRLLELSANQKTLYDGLFMIYQQGLANAQKLDSVNQQVQTQSGLIYNTNQGVANLTTMIQELMTKGQLNESACFQQINDLTAQLQAKWEENNRRIEEYNRLTQEKTAALNENQQLKAAADREVDRLRAERQSIEDEKNQLAQELEEKKHDIGELQYELERKQELTVSGEQLSIALDQQKVSFELTLASKDSDYNSILAKWKQTLEEAREVARQKEEADNVARQLAIQLQDEKSKSVKVGELTGQVLLLTSQKSTAERAKADAESKLLRQQSELKELKERASKDTSGALVKAQQERSDVEQQKLLVKVELESTKRELEQLRLEKEAALNDAKNKKLRQEELGREITELRRQEEEKEKMTQLQILELQRVITEKQGQITLYQEEEKQLRLVPHVDHTADIQRLEREKKRAEEDAKRRADDLSRTKKQLDDQIALLQKVAREKGELHETINVELEKKLYVAQKELQEEKTRNSKLAGDVGKMRQYKLSRVDGLWQLQREDTSYDNAFVHSLTSVQTLVAAMNNTLREQRKAVVVKTPFLAKLGMQTRLASHLSQQEDELLAGLMAQRTGGEFMATVSFYGAPSVAFPEGELRQSFTHSDVNEFQLETHRVIVINLDHYPLDKLQLKVNGTVFRTIPVRGRIEYIVQRKFDKQTVALSGGRRDYEIADTAGLPYMTAVDTDIGQARLKCRVIGAGYVRLNAIQLMRQPEKETSEQPLLSFFAEASRK